MQNCVQFFVRSHEAQIMNYGVARYMASTVLLILFGIQAVSRSQYYASSDPYPLVSPITATGSENEPNRNRNINFFNTRNYHPPYRQHQHHYHIFNDPIGTTTTTVRYYGTRLPTEIGRNVEVIFDGVPYNAGKSLASYRRGYNRQPVTQIPEFRQFDRPDIEFNEREDGQMEIRSGADRAIEFPASTLERPLDTLPSFQSVANCEAGYLLSRSDGKCYPVSKRGPCGELMSFYPDANNDKYGSCDCEISNGLAARPIVWWRPQNRCYLLYLQGPCYYNEWLILDGDDIPRCAPRKCSHDITMESENGNVFWFLYKGRCYKTGEHHPRFCNKEGQEEFKVWFEVGANEPKCLRQMPDPLFRALLAPVNDLPCRPGHKKMQNGECKRTARFDEDY